MSMFAEYLKEREEKTVLETEYGFVVYKIQNEECYFQDIFVKPEYRKGVWAHSLAKQVENIARERGCKVLSGTIVPTTHGSTYSLHQMLKFGFELDMARDNLIVLFKRL